LAARSNQEKAARSPLTPNVDDDNAATNYGFKKNVPEAAAKPTATRELRCLLGRVYGVESYGLRATTPENFSD
jgi:hypothetical protein